jgi:hypothetical protein
MGQRPIVAGLTNQFSSKLFCDKCGISLSASTWQGIQVVYSRSKSRASGFVCCTCARRANKNKNVLATIEELDEFVSYLISKVVK